MRISVVVGTFGTCVGLAACSPAAATPTPPTTATPTPPPPAPTPPTTATPAGIELRSVAWSPDGTTIAVGAFTQTIVIDADTRRELARVGESLGWHQVSFRPDGRLITQGDGADTVPAHWRSIVWEARTGKRLAIATAPSACANDTEQWWGCRADGTGWRVHYQTWDQHAVLERWDGAALHPEWSATIGRSMYRQLLAVSPSGAVASAGKEAYSLTQTEPMLVHTNDKTPAGDQRRYSYENHPKLVGGGFVRIHSGKAFRCEKLGLGKDIVSVQFSADGRSLVAGDASGTVFVVSSDCKLVHTLTGLRGAAVGVAARADRVVAISSTGAMRWWDLASGSAIATTTLH